MLLVLVRQVVVLLAHKFIRQGESSPKFPISPIRPDPNNHAAGTDTAGGGSST